MFPDLMTKGVVFDCLGVNISLLFVSICLIVLQLKLMHNALSTDKRRDDLKEIIGEIQTIMEG